MLLSSALAFLCSDEAGDRAWGIFAVPHDSGAVDGGATPAVLHADLSYERLPVAAAVARAIVP